jgi:uncharacterized repeat protein (TIGR01451 family)
MVVAILATSVVGAVAATPSAASAASCDCIKYRPELYGSSIADEYAYIDLTYVNDSDRYWTDNRVSVTLPTGVELNWSTLSDENYDPTTRTVTGLPKFYGLGYQSNTLSPWEQDTPYLRVHLDASLEGQSVTIRSTANFTSDQGIPGGIINSVTFQVTPQPDPFDYRTETRFTPDSTNYSGTTTLTSKVYNDGPGNGGMPYVEIYFDDELTLVSDLPEDCREYDSWGGQKEIDCDGEVPEDGAGPGLVASWTFTLQVPDAPIPASVDSQTFEASTKLGCSTSGALGSTELNEDNNSDSAFLTVPASPAGLLAVARNLPAYVDQPGVVTNPTAGRSMSSSVDVFNAGDATIGGPIIVTIAPMPGFTPTSISATSTDSATPAPSCVLATLTCTFTQLGDGLRGRIVIVGDLAPTIANGTDFSSSVTASAAGFTTATDTDTTKIAALAEGNITVSSVTNASPGEQVSYGVTVSNGGPSTMANPVVTLTLPAGMTIVDLPDICTQSGNTVTCTLPGSLDPEQDYSFGFTAGLPDEVGDHTITATLSSATPLADASVTGADHSVATATTVTDLVEASTLPYTGSNSGTLALIGAGLALGGLILVSATGRIATRRRND